jgi:hypothetical protein
LLHRPLRKICSEGSIDIVLEISKTFCPHQILFLVKFIEYTITHH